MFFQTDDKILVTLLFSKHQQEGKGVETALTLDGDSFNGRVVFDRYSSSHFLTGDRCNTVPRFVLIRLISADGGESDRRVLKFPDDFEYSAEKGQYAAHSAVVLKGWCEPKCPQASSEPCQKTH